MAKRKSYVQCAACGVTDKPGPIPPNADGETFNVGTVVTMDCPDCSAGKVNRYGTPQAQRCRACCPTGHATRWNAEPTERTA